jgi:murein L,D-transpeptidase YafK
MKLLLYSFILISFLKADMTILNNYRQNINWQEKADKALYSDEYINYLLKNRDVKFGYYDNPTNVIVCFKNKKDLFIYNYNKKLQLSTKFTNILTGKNSGDKWIEGDGKTPIGVYTLKYKLDDNKLSDFYGPLAYPTNYPNLYDKYLGKCGHGIWIHGFPKDNPNRDFNTKGCIAIPNNELIKLSKKIDYKDTILIIDTKNLLTTNKNKIAIILKNLFKWRYDWKYNKLDEYLSFYDKNNFKKDNKLNFKQFTNMKKVIFSHQKHKILKFSNIQITPYPSSEKKNIYRISFYELFKSGSHTFQGKKILYLQLIDNKIKIFLEN